jgi:DNA replication protein DnaC
MRSDIFQEAKRRIDRRHMNQELALSARIDEIREKLPEVIQIRRQLAMTSAEISKLILQKNTDIQAGIARIEQVNLQLQQREKELLTGSGYPADYLELRYDCPLCRDTGFVDGRRCRCLQQEMQKLSVEQLNKAFPLQDSGFDSFDLRYYPDETDPRTGQNPYQYMTRVLRYCRQYAENFQPHNPGIFMMGETGLGKTHLSLAIAGVVAAKGYDVVYGSAQDLLRRVENEHFGRTDSQDTLDTMLAADLLILDDLGSEFGSSFSQSIVYNILNSRLSANRPTIISTNLKAAELEEKYAQRVVSRLCTQLVQMRFIGRDVRQLKQRKK